MNERQRLMRKIQMYDFACDDIALYLDTHPTDQTALSQYAQYVKIYKQSMDEYNRKYGPLQQEDYNGSPMWKWIESPWPWDYEGKV